MSETIIRSAKCLDCEEEYNIFPQFTDIEGRKLGLSFEDYKCPKCKSTNKKQLGQADFGKSEIEGTGWKSIGSSLGNKYGK